MKISTKKTKHHSLTHNLVQTNFSKIIPPPSPTDWLIERKSYNRGENGYYESLFALSNGYMGVRNTIDFSDPNTKPGIFIAGLYDKAPIVFTELAKIPSWLRWEISGISTRHEFILFTLREGEQNLYQALDMQKGTIYSRFILTSLTSSEKSTENKKLHVEIFQFPHSIKKELFLAFINITPLNFTGKISIKFFLENTSSNEGLYPWVQIHHFKTIETGFLQKYTTSNRSNDRETRGIYLLSTTRATKEGLFQCSITNQYDFPDYHSININYKRGYSENMAWEELSFDAEEGKTYPVQRIIFNKFPVSLPEDSNGKEGTEIDTDRLTHDFLNIFTSDIKKLINSHIKKWEKKWENAWIYLEGDTKSLEAVRFNTFQLLQVYDELSPNTSIPAKGLTGEGYRGHVFWDTEIFMFPFYLYTNPKAAKKLLLYRFERLTQAKENAKNEGNAGARFPWESAQSGKEVTPYEIYDFVEDKKYFIYTGKEEIHVTADIAYAVVQYFEATNDTEFFQNVGLPILIESARFWASRAKWDKEKKAFVIKKVIGPDEYHEHVDNSFFTNFMASWNLKESIKFLKQIGTKFKNKQSLDLPGEEELKNWEKIANNIYLPTNSEGIIEEFEGYFDLKNTTINEWDQNYMPIIPEQIKNTVDKTQLIKQGDVVLLFHLHPEAFKPDVVKKNFLYYQARTTHASSLSPMIYAIVGLKAGIEEAALRNFLRTSRVDLDNNQGNIQLGLHLAACGGTWQSIVNGFGGTRISKEGIKINPRLPELWKLLQFRVKWHGNQLKITITKEQIDIKLEDKNIRQHSKTNRIDLKIPINSGGGSYYLDETNKKITIRT